MAEAPNSLVLVDDWLDELDIEPTFIGRQKDIKIILDGLNGRIRLFGIFGIRSVGKSRLVKEVISRYIDGLLCIPGAEGAGRAPTVVRVDLSHHTSISDVHVNLCTSLGVDPDVTKKYKKAWIVQIQDLLRARRKEQFILFFDNVENAEVNPDLKEGLMSLFWHLASKCVNVKTFITSTTKFMSSRLTKVYFIHELLPLNPSESADLFKAIAPDVELGDYGAPLVKLSEGLPLMISMIANELADDSGMISPADMVEMLASNRLKCLSRQDFYAAEDRIADIYKQFLQRLPPSHRRQLAQLGYIPGSFDYREARELLGYARDHEVADQVLFPIRRRYMLNFDPKTRRFNIQGILRDCLEVYFVIRNITELRKKYIRVFTSVMTKVCERLGTDEYTRALSEVSVEQPNFRKLLDEVSYTTEDTYPFFITVATTCTELIERFMLKKCDKFYQGCLVMASRYGSDVDKAMVNIAVGSMWTNAKGNLLKGASYYKDALKVLVPTGNKLQLATIYQRMGWNLHVQGKDGESLEYYRKSLNISQTGGQQFHRLAIQSMNSLGLSFTTLGNFDEAERHHFSALRLAKAVLKENHPSIGAILNNIGLLYEIKGDAEKARSHMEQGLEIKRKSKAPPISILMSLSNVACQYSALRQYDNAHRLLDEGMEILDNQEMPSRPAKAILYDSKGKILMSQKRFQEAVTMFEKAADIREEIASDSIVYVETLVHLAIAKKCVGLYSASEKTARKMLKLKEKAKEVMPHSTLIAECYECLADVYEKTRDDKKYLVTLQRLEAELRRLEQVHMCSCNETSVEKVRKQLDIIREKLFDHGNQPQPVSILYRRSDV